MHDIVEFLHRYPPFDDLEEQELDDLSRTVEVEFFPAGTTILRQQEEPPKHVWIVRRGAVELVDHGRVLDVLGEGDLFGHQSMLSGLPTGFAAVASEDSLCYRLPAENVVPLLDRHTLGRSAALADVDPAQRPVATLLHERPVVCEPTCSMRDAARRMTDAGASSALVRLPNHEFGILTDRDLREYIAANGSPGDARITEAMSAPAFTVEPERPGTEVMLEMLDRGIRHVPVIPPDGDPLGVLSDIDLLAVDTRSPFWLRRAIGEARDTEELGLAARQLRPTVITLHDAEFPPVRISAIFAIVVDAMTRRLIELAIDDLGPPPCPLTWLAMGSLGRREIVPSSDIDSALVWDGDDTEAEQQRYMQALGKRVVDELAAIGFAADVHGATAAQPLFEHSAKAWHELIQRSVEHPGEEGALILISLLYDARPVHGAVDAWDVLEEFRAARGRRSLLHLLLRLALVHRPPTGFRRFRDSPRDFVVEHSGEHRGKLDIKETGLLPIAAVARYASLAAGTVTTSTRERLRAAAESDTLSLDEARMLEEAYDLLWGLRLDHQVEQMRRGDEPDDHIDPRDLDPLTRRYLRDAFGAVRSIQRALSNKLTFG
jgi:CBS domain-containing protein